LKIFGVTQWRRKKDRLIYPRLQVTFAMPEARLASKSYLVAAVGAMLPAAWSMVFVWMAFRSDESKRALTWFNYLRRMRVLNLLTIPAWWSLFDWLADSGRPGGFIPDWPGCVLFILPLTFGVASGRLVSVWSGVNFTDHRWTIVDKLRLVLWVTLSSTVPMLLFATGLDAVGDHKMTSLFWIVLAATVGVVARLGLRAAEGLKPRAVKSGELFKRSYAMAKRNGVPLRGVFVVPTGRGRLLNAYTWGNRIGMADVCVHWTHGAQLDFLIGHELAHLRRGHALKGQVLDIAFYLGVALLAFFVPHSSPAWSIQFKFGAILIPVLASRFVSRRFEFEADRVAVEYTRDFEAAMRALVNLYRRAEMPGACAEFYEIFQTHPSLWRRIDAIARVGRVRTSFVAGLRTQFNDKASDLPSEAG
jgi:Zn-dependent protease with chaperone function